MFDLQHFGRVVDHAISVVVVANCTVKQMVAEYPVECLALGGICSGGLGLDCHPVGQRRRECPDQLPVHLDQTSVTRLDRP